VCVDLYQYMPIINGIKLGVFFLGIMVSQIAKSNCFSFQRDTIPPSSTRTITLNISGAVNDDLADINQCVAAVSLSFRHPRVIHMTIRLVSPFGDIITLVGGNGLGNPTNLGRWDISFAPCSESAIPDPSFDAVFNTGNNWGNGNYSGVYYPNQGCLENFNQGSVNGEWQLIITNSSPFDEGVFLGLGMFFCDSEGLDCFVCNPGQTTISTNRSNFCEGSDSLRLNISRRFIGFEPDPFLYRYTFLTFQGDTLYNRGNNVDLRNAPIGDYQVCGLSFFNEEESLLPMVGDTLTGGLLNVQLSSNDPVFCGRLSNCITISIASRPDTVFIADTICIGEVYLFGDQELTTNIRDTLFLQTFAGCDSVVVLNLHVAELEWDIIGVDSLPCDSSAIIKSVFQINGTAIWDDLSFQWFNSGGTSISSSDTVLIENTGLYFLTIEGVYLNNKSCTFLDSFEIGVESFEFVPQLPPLFSTCPGVEITLSLIDYVDGIFILWDIPSELELIGSNASDSIRIRGSEAGNFQVCASVMHPCMDTIQICTLVDISTSPNLGIPSRQTICGRMFEIAITNLQNIGISQITLGLQSDIQIQTDRLLITHPSPGNVTYEITGVLGSCAIQDTFEIEFIDTSFLEASISIIDSCTNEPMILLEFSNQGPINFELVISSPSGMENLVISAFSTQQFNFTYTPPMEGVIRLDRLSFDSGICNFDLEDSISFLFPGEIVFLDLFERCNSNLQGGNTLLDLGNPFENLGVILGIDAGELNGRLDGLMLDLEGADSGRYTIDVSYSRQGCPDQISQILLEISPCLCPVFAENTSSIIICEGDPFELNSVWEFDVSGIWTLISGPVSDIGDINTGSIEDNILVPGFYTFHFDPNEEDCEDSYIFSFEVLSLKRTGRPTADLINICLDNFEPFFLEDWITDQDAGGVWTISSPSSGFDLEPNSGRITPLFFQSVVLEVSYSFIDDSCAETPAVIKFEITILPQEDLVDTLYLDCGESEVQLNLGVEWFLQDGLLQIQGESSDFSVNAISGIISFFKTGQYELIWGSPENNCQRQYTISIVNRFEPIQDVVFEIMPPLCLGNLTGWVQLIEVIGGEAPFVWQINQTTSGMMGDTVFLNSGTYLFRIIDSNGCEFFGSFTIDLPPSGSVDLGPDLNSAIGSEVTLQPNIMLDILRNKVNMTWRIDGVTVCENCESFTFIISDNHLVEVYLVDDQGCLYTDSILIRINPGSGLYLPNAFSPNSDGINDELKIYTRPGYGLIQYWHIYDRWGNRVFAVDTPFTNDMTDHSWDGRFNGVELLPGIYISTMEILLQNGVTRRFVQEVQILR
jgi:gliding motility-associated-like protein